MTAGALSELVKLDSALIEAAGECGLRSFVALGGYCGADPVPTRVLAYEAPWGVGYLTALVGDAAIQAASDFADSAAGVADSDATAGRKGGMPGADASEIVTLARAAIELWIRHGTEYSEPRLVGDEYPLAAGAFVSLHRHG